MCRVVGNRRIHGRERSLNCVAGAGGICCSEQVGNRHTIDRLAQRSRGRLQQVTPAGDNCGLVMRVRKNQAVLRIKLLFPPKFRSRPISDTGRPMLNSGQ